MLATYAYIVRIVNAPDPSIRDVRLQKWTKSSELRYDVLVYHLDPFF